LHSRNHCISIAPITPKASDIAVPISKTLNGQRDGNVSFFESFFSRSSPFNHFHSPAALSAIQMAIKLLASTSHQAVKIARSTIPTAPGSQDLERSCPIDSLITSIVRLVFQCPTITEYKNPITKNPISKNVDVFSLSMLEIFT
jgi:hypothetical protein